MDRRTIENHLNITSLDNVIEGLVGNMDDDDIDRYIRVCDKICRNLGIRSGNYGDCVVLVDKYDEFVPTQTNQRNQEDKSRKITSARVYGIPMVWENGFVNGARWYYFKSEEDALDYVMSYIDDIYDGEYDF